MRKQFAATTGDVTSITNVAPGKKKKLSVLSQSEKKHSILGFFFAVTLKLRLGLNLTITMRLAEKQS